MCIVWCLSWHSTTPTPTPTSSPTSREDLREDVRFGVGVGVVEFRLYTPAFAGNVYCSVADAHWRGKKHLIFKIHQKDNSMENYKQTGKVKPETVP